MMPTYLLSTSIAGSKMGTKSYPGCGALHLRYGKSPGEIALYWEAKRAVLAGDLIVGAPMGKFSLLMDEKLEQPDRAALQLRRILALDFDAILVGDGHSILQNAREALLHCLEQRSDIYINRLNADELEWSSRSARPVQSGSTRSVPDAYVWDEKEIGALIGARRLGYRLIRLPAGKSTFPLHFHYVTEELFHILEGECTLVSPRGEVAVMAGDFIAFPPGPQSAHKFVNRAGETCIMLALGEEDEDDLCEYPDSDKILTKRLPGWGIFRKLDRLSYWDGEGG